MALQINEVVPNRFRAGDLITVRGFGFAPGFGDNAVSVDGIPEILQVESATELTFFVPAGVSVDQYVTVQAFRSDTLDNDVAQAWSSSSLSDLRDGTARIPGQVPGAREAADPSPLADVPQAQDYERLVQAIEHLLYDALSVVGDLFASDGAEIVPQPIGAAGQRLGANPATATGMEYAALTRATSLQWGGRKLAANTVVDAIVANGQSSETSTIAGIHLAPATGIVGLITVLFAEGVAGDTLDQVILRKNGAIAFDSGTGLGITPGNAFESPGLVVAIILGTDTVELEVRKLGTNGDGDFVGHAVVR